jgi:hypothetical protein
VSYVIDPRKNWALAEERLATETDPKRRRNLETLIAHSKSEARPDFDALMATVVPNASYTSYAAGSGEGGTTRRPEAAASAPLSRRRSRGRRRR